MAKMTVTIPDAIAGGIAAARLAFNDALPEQRDDDGNVVQHPDLIESDADYFNARVIGMVQSWADQHGVSQASVDKAKAEFIAKMPAGKRASVEAAVTAELAKA